MQLWDLVGFSHAFPSGVFWVGISPCLLEFSALRCSDGWAVPVTTCGGSLGALRFIEHRGEALWFLQPSIFSRVPVNMQIMFIGKDCSALSLQALFPSLYRDSEKLAKNTYTASPCACQLSAVSS